MTDFNTAVEEIRARIDIVDIISEHVALKKAGRNWTGLCPFHNEKTPSFMVNRDKNIFKCFGCGAGGDGFSFLQKLTNKSFAEVIADLAAKYGIKINYSNDAIDARNQILELNKLTAKFYAENLLKTESGKKAKQYLNNRGISDETILQFNLGYAPEGWDNLIKNLKKQASVSNETLETAGLVTQSSKDKTRYYDRFRDRVIIPIHNDRGQVIAFGGRSLTEENVPKYLNSPETPVFHKGKNIYALYQARESIKTEDCVILVEGYFDAISAHAHGVKNVVATLGTALTSYQLRLLGKYTESKRLYMAFDADQAGIDATDRGIEVIKETFGSLGGIKILEDSYSSNSVYEIRVISIPEGKDPDDFIQNKGADTFKRLAKSAPLLLDYQINKILNANDTSSVQGKVNVSKELAKLLSEISSPIVRSEYIKIVADKLSVREEDLLTEVRQTRRTGTKRSTINQELNKTLTTDKQELFQKAERNLLSLYFVKEAYWELITSKLQGYQFSDNNLELLKATIIDSLSSSHTVQDLTQNVLSTLASNTEATEILSDILFKLDDKYCLDNEKSINLFISENIAFISRFISHNTETNLKKNYYENQDDEIKSLEVQYRLREHLNTRLTAL